MENKKNIINKYGNQEPMLSRDEARVPIGFKETSPGIIRKNIGVSVPSIKSAKERLHASKPWKPKGGRAIDAAKNGDPGSKGPSMKVGHGPGYDDLKGYELGKSTKSGYTKVK